jgi:hypothetical protein
MRATKNKKYKVNARKWYLPGYQQISVLVFRALWWVLWFFICVLFELFCLTVYIAVCAMGCLKRVGF